MPFHRNFTYWIDKRKWKYSFLIASLQGEEKSPEVGSRKSERRKHR
jgi:hypothetical protein